MKTIISATLGLILGINIGLWISTARADEVPKTDPGHEEFVAHYMVAQTGEDQYVYISNIKCPIEEVKQAFPFIAVKQVGEQTIAGCWWHLGNTITLLFADDKQKVMNVDSNWFRPLQ